jgi:hypothetical protein
MRGKAFIVVLGGAALLLWLSRSHPEHDPDAATSTVVTSTGTRIARTGATLRPQSEAARPLTELSGVAALREFSDDFAEANGDALREHMAREKLTRQETLELTFFALVASESQDWDTVEQLTGHAIQAEARRQAWVQMQQRSRQMREELQAMVKRGASEEERWEAIDQIESSYLDDYYRVTGMSPALLDQLLWLSVQGQNRPELAAAMSPSAGAGVPPGANCVKRDPENPNTPPIPVPCPR